MILKRLHWLGTYSIHILPPLIFLLATVFYYGLFFKWNSGALFKGEILTSHQKAQLEYSVDLCRVSETKVQIRAWIAQRGRSSSDTSTLLLVRAPGSSQYRHIKSRIELRPDVSDALNRKFSDDLNYIASGLVGSLNFGHSRSHIERGRVYAAYHTGSGYRVAELPCTF